MTWKTTYEGLTKLKEAGRLGKKGSQLNYKRYIDDFPATELLNVWTDTMNSFMQRHYVVETNTVPIQRCILMTTDPGDLVIDITCGSGVTAYVAEKFGRRWITCDTSRIATFLARQRLLTATFPYYILKDVNGGVSSGFEYKVIPHVTLETIANGENPTLEIMYDEPLVDKTKIRVSGPFTMEAIPSPTVKPIESIEGSYATDVSSKQSEWRDQLKATGIITRAGNVIKFSRVEPLVGTTFLQAEAETKDDIPRKAVICFANESSPLDSKTVSAAMDEAELIRPLPKLIIFCAFQFDPEAARFIDETKWPNVQLLKVQMNTDLLIEDLMKRDPSSQSFWMIGQPDVICEKISNGEFAGKYQVRVRGFDYYNPNTGTIQSGDSSKIAMWLLDTEYDG